MGLKRILIMTNNIRSVELLFVIKNFEKYCKTNFPQYPTLNW